MFCKYKICIATNHKHYLKLYRTELVPCIIDLGTVIIFHLRYFPGFILEMTRARYRRNKFKI